MRNRKPPRELLTLRKANPSGRDSDPRRTLPLNSAAWYRLRARVLAEEPLCRHCGQPATDVDHLSGDPSDNRRANLQPLCHPCHSHKTGRERAGLGIVHGCDADGMPRDPAHPWNAEKSPEGESSSTGRPLFFHPMAEVDMRQTRSDSATAAVQAAQNAAQGPLEPPAHVTVPDEARPFWAALVHNRPRHKWNEADLATAAMLARAQYDAERLAREIDAEGDLIDGKLNPKHALVDKLGRRIMSLSRLLHVHPEATEGRAREQGNALEVERKAEATVHPLIRRA